MQGTALDAALFEKIKSKKATIAVVGVGYVGQAVGMAFAKAGFKTVGVDVDLQRVDYINNLKIEGFVASPEFSSTYDADVFCICVPTSIDEKRRADYKILLKVVDRIAQNLKKGTLVVLESSVAPGVSKTLILPRLAKTKLVLGKDIFFAHSPERIDPGNNKFTIVNTPKIVGAGDNNSLKLAYSLYGKICKEVVKVASIETAELVKVLENTFRLVNISLINEIGHFAKKMNVDIWEVISAASTKPYGFLAHYPGPGIGGDCIPVIPYHFLAAAKKNNVKLRVVDASLKVNELQPGKVVEKVKEVLKNNINGNGKSHRQKVMLVGVSYKEGVSDLRQSPALRIWEGLKKEGIDVLYHDPFVPHVNGYASETISQELLNGLDAIVVTTAHKNIEYDSLVSSGKPVIDTRNVLSKYRQSHILKL